MVYGELRIHHYLVLDQNENDNAYSTPLRYEVWKVDHEIVIMVIHLCCNTFSHLGAQHQNYSEHDTVCLYIIFPLIIYCFCPDQTYHFCGTILSDGFEIT